MNRSLVLAIVVIATLIAAIFAAHAHDSGQWENSDPQVRDWYQHLMQPDVPNASCCGEADAYWCDDIHVRQNPVTHESNTFCAITDDRDDAPRNRPHRPLGEEHEIPTNKLKYDRGNPTGHAIIFLGRPGYDFVFCFVQPGGV